MISTVKFLFRVLLSNPEDSPEIEIWVHEHRWDQLKTPNHFEEWVMNSLQDVDWRNIKVVKDQISDDKPYELLGKGKLTGYYYPDGEYEENFEIEEVSVREVELLALPEGYFLDSKESTTSDKPVEPESKPYIPPMQASWDPNWGSPPPKESSGSKPPENFTPITLQSIFNVAWQAFIVEKRPPAVTSVRDYYKINPLSIEFRCVYKTKDNKRCAIGLSIPEGHPYEGFSGSFGEMLIYEHERINRNSFVEANDREASAIFDPGLVELALDVYGQKRLDYFQSKLHDSLISGSEWGVTHKEKEEAYRKVAAEYNLTIPEKESNTNEQAEN